MKMAIIFGVSQMLLGFFLKLSNAIYFKRPMDIAFEVLPQIAMFIALYAYACFLIIYKWTIDWNVAMGSPAGSIPRTPPDLITMLINLVLAPGTVKDPLYDGQDVVQMRIIYLSLVCILMMLFPKPILLYMEQQKKNEHGGKPRGHSLEGMLEHHEDGESKEDEEEGAHHEEHDITDEIVHIGIETIEFILGSVSNTASYLRLWALSLAHAQLAEGVY
jgi:V-type H+-transporting ATPase subunit a